MRNLSKKEKFLRLLSKTFKYRGDVNYTKKLYKKYLRLLKVYKTPTKEMLFGSYKSRNVLFYISRGWDEVDAKEQVRKIQSRGIEFYKGDDNKIKERVKKRDRTFSLKPEEEIKEINKKKSRNYNPEFISKKYNISLEDASIKIESMKKKRIDSFSRTMQKIGGYKKEWSVWCVEYYLNRGHTIESAKELLINKTKNFKRYSIKATKVIEKIINLCDKNNIKNITFLYAENEFHLYDPISKKARWYDLTIPELNLIVEYNGSVFHPREKDSMYYTVSESIGNDAYKNDLAKKSGYDILYIWDRGSQILQINAVLTEIKKRYEQYFKIK